MLNLTLEQLAELINKTFGNRLTTEERTLAAQIVKEIGIEAESKALALGEWRARVNQFEQDLHTRLSQADTPSQRAALRFASLFLQQIASEAAINIFNNPQESLTFLEQGLEHAENFLRQGETAAAVRERVLILYYNAGFTLEVAPFNDAERQLKTYQRGLEHAENFFTQGETTAGVREEVLRLYDSISAEFHNSGQIGLQIQHLPALGFWSWISLAKAEKRARILDNWRKTLETAPAYPDFTAAFQAFLHTLLLKWHDPESPHRHSISTETLLDISESLYGLEQAVENQKLQTVYDHFTHLAHSRFVQGALAQQKEQTHLQHTLDTLNKKALLYPLRRWWFNKKLQDNQQLIQEQAQLAKNADDWQRAIKRTEYALVEWLTVAIVKPPRQLTDLLEIALGMLFASDTIQTGKSPETLLEKWQTHPPWETAEALRTAYAPSNWQRWANNSDKSPLSNWVGDLERNETETVRRLNIAWKEENKAQPKLQTWLRELLTDTPQTLQQYLKIAWQTAQSNAPLVAQIFTAFDKPDFNGDLFAKNEDKESPDYTYTDAAYQRALSTIILGDLEKQIEKAVEKWLAQQCLKNENLNVFNTLKHRFTRATAIYHYRTPQFSLEMAVHNWAKALLQETAQSPTDFSEQNFYNQTPQHEPVKVWEILERTRVGLNSLKLRLPENWAETLGEELWKALEMSIRDLNEGHEPTEQEMWPPLNTWLKTVNQWFENRPPDVETCQTHLQPNEVLVQPFFDPAKNRLRLLWLDKNSLTINDLTDKCALESLWFAKNSLITEWMDSLKTLKKDLDILKEDGIPKNFEKVMGSEPVQTFADQLRDWAETFTQITIIFPAPLGQLPWETLPQLENKLVREISLAHWLKLKTSRTAPEAQNKELKPWVVSDPGEKTSCMVKEGRWVAEHLNTTLHLPCPSVFDALQHFAHDQHIHLSTHGKYVIKNPLKSGLILETEKEEEKTTAKITLPLWTLSHAPIPANLVLLSACESNLNGLDTEGLLTPVGIGPAIAAAGAKTVIGTLWSCDGIAALCFSYYFYQIMEKEPNLPWHQVVAQARQTLKETTEETLKTIAKKVQIDEKCKKDIETLQAQAKDRKKPFQAFYLWAGFVMLGETGRGRCDEYNE